MATFLEHANLTVSDLDKSAEYLKHIFDWPVRWRGGSIDNGESIHVGPKDSYLALYRGPGSQARGPSSYTTLGGFNHVGVVVDDIEATEQRVKECGFETHSHADYEPGKRFYFHDHDGLEIEVVSYA